MSHQRSAHTSTLNLGAERLQRGRAEQRACPESLGWFSSFDNAASKPSDLRCRAYEPSQEVRAALPGAAVRLQDKSGSANDPPAREVLHSERRQRVTVFTQFSENSFFRGLPWLSADALRFMEVVTVDSAPPPHPILAKSVPSHLKRVFSKCTRAAKMAWISESRLAEFPDEDVTDEHLDKLYKVACRNCRRT